MVDAKWAVSPTTLSVCFSEVRLVAKPHCLRSVSSLYDDPHGQLNQGVASFYLHMLHVFESVSSSVLIRLSLAAWQGIPGVMYIGKKSVIKTGKGLLNI